MNVLTNINNLKKCYLSFGGSTVDLFSVQLNLTMGQFPSCTVLVSEASNSFPQIDEECSVFINLDGTAHNLFNGYIIADTQSISTSATHVAGYRQYQIAIDTEGVDSVPPNAWTYLTNAVDIENGVLQGYVLVGNNAQTGKSNAQSNLQGNNNIAQIILKTMDELQSSTVGQAGGDAISRLFTYDNAVLNMSGSHDLTYYITDKATNLIQNGSSYIQAVQTLCSEFYLSILPKQQGNSKYKMHIAYKPGWGKGVTQNIALSDYTGIITTNTSIRNREIDGVIMPYWDTTGQNPNDLGQYAFYGRKENGAGLTMEIVDHNSLKNYFGATTSGLRYKQIPTPTWLAKGLSTSELQRAVRGIVKSYFATHAYAQRRINIDIPLVHFLNLRNKIGDIVSLEAFSDNLEGLDKGSRRNTKKYIGQLLNVGLNISFVQSKLVVNCTAHIAFVRTEDVNKSMNFTAADLLYR